MRLSALYWGLASVYRAAIDHSQKVKAETETQTMPPETNDAPIESTEIRVQTQLEVSAVSTKSMECGTQTQLKASMASASPIETEVQTMDFMDIGTHTTTSAVKAMTEPGTQTINPEITIAPVVKKKTWIKEVVEPTGPPPQLVREKEEEGAKGPIPSASLREEGVTAREEGTRNTSKGTRSGPKKRRHDRTDDW
ncbi:hypothetical protein BTVI_38045 [Pitangus sulphuratus]|nr:hypothetical protein BTVI_38045 [Pitangus sulphuratus]